MHLVRRLLSAFSGSGRTRGTRTRTRTRSRGGMLSSLFSMFRGSRTRSRRGVRV